MEGGCSLSLGCRPLAAPARIQQVVQLSQPVKLTDLDGYLLGWIQRVVALAVRYLVGAAGDGQSAGVNHFSSGGVSRQRMKAHPLIFSSKTRRGAIRYSLAL